MHQRALYHHFGEIPEAQLGAYVSTHAKNDDCAVEMKAIEQSVDVLQLAHFESHHGRIKSDDIKSPSDSDA